MPSQRETARSGRKALSVLKALNGPMLPRPMISAQRLTIDIWTTKSDALENKITYITIILFRIERDSFREHYLRALAGRVGLRFRTSEIF